MGEVKIINLTAHTITEVTTGIAIPTSGRIARVKTKTRKIGDVLGFPIFNSEISEIEGIPDEEEGVTYIVSVLIMKACPERKDLLSPGNIVRNENGQPIGCVGFKSNFHMNDGIRV